MDLLIIIIQSLTAIAIAYIGYQSKKTHEIVNSQRTEMLAKIDNLEKSILPLKEEIAARQEEVRGLRDPEPPLALVVPPPPIRAETRRPK